GLGSNEGRERDGPRPKRAIGRCGAFPASRGWDPSGRGQTDEGFLFPARLSVLTETESLSHLALRHLGRTGNGGNDRAPAGAEGNLFRRPSGGRGSAGRASGKRGGRC